MTGRDQYGNEWALVGTVLQRGGPVRDALVGRTMRSQRNPVSCYDTSDLDALATADRAAPQGREGVTVIATRTSCRWRG
jgi:hypothetical protein